MRRFYSILLMLCIMVPLIVNAVNAAQTRESEVFSTTKVYAEATGNKNVLVEFYVATTSTQATPDAMGAKKIEIQEFAPGNSEWKPVATYTSEKNPDFLGYNVRIHEGKVLYQGKLNCLYRAEITFICTKAGKTEIREMTTKNVMAK